MSFIVDKVIGETPLVIQFTDTTVDAVAWEWDFGDGTSSEEQNPKHTFYTENSYTVVQVVTLSDTTTVTVTRTHFIISVPGETTAEETCLRFATEENEGRGWSKLTGTNWIDPADNFGVSSILDDNAQDRVVCHDQTDFRVYEIDTSDRIVHDRPAPVDKEGIQNSEISWEKREAETVFSIIEERKFITHEDSSIDVRPDDVRNRGAEGYAATGLRNAQQLTLKAYADGEQTDAGATAENFPEGGEVVFSGRKMKSNRQQMAVSGTASEITVLNHIHNFLGSDEAKSTAKRTMTEHTIQLELATGMLLHVCRGILPLLNRVTGLNLGSGTAIAGPDGQSYSAVSCGATTLDNAAAVSDYTVVIWIKSGSGISGVAGMTLYGTHSGFLMYHKRAASGLAANRTLLSGEYFGIRIYSKQLSADALEYLYDDIVAGGKAVCPV
jgi:PKD repeat protein